jgi:hypothetical protein
MAIVHGPQSMVVVIQGPGIVNGLAAASRSKNKYHLAIYLVNTLQGLSLWLIVGGNANNSFKPLFVRKYNPLYIECLITKLYNWQNRQRALVVYTLPKHLFYY